MKPRTQNLFIFKTWADWKASRDRALKSQDLCRLYAEGLLHKDLEKEFEKWRKERECQKTAN